MEFFGLSIKRKKPATLETFDVDSDPGASIVEENGVQISGVNGYFHDLAAVPSDERELIESYRSMQSVPEIDLALNEIENEVFIFDVPGKKAFEIAFTVESKISDKLKKRIQEEFDELYQLTDFHNRGLEYFMKWYVDGRIYFHKIVDKNKIREGIKKVMRIDPLRIKKIKQMPKKDNKGVYDISKIKESYLFTPNPNGRDARQTHALEIAPDAITYVDSGIYDEHEEKVLGFLHKAIVPLNNLKLLEESIVIYRVSRAPERRVIYVDVGNLPKNKAEAYIQALMNKFRNKLVYDTKSGSIVDRKNVLSMIEDYWLPRRESGKGTQIDTLPGGENLGIINDVDYFKDKLMNSLNVPASRFSDQAPSFVFGRGVEINRDEYRFKKFIDKVRLRFMRAIEDLLKTHLVLKKVIDPEEWDDLRNSFYFEFTEDNNFVEYKESELLASRVQVLSDVDQYVGRYFNTEWVMKNVLKMSEDEIKSINKVLEKNPEVPAEVEFGQIQQNMVNDEEPSTSNTQVKNQTQVKPNEEDTRG